MKNITHISISIITLVIVLSGCTGSRKLSKKSQSGYKYNKEALNLVIDGAISDVIGHRKEALLKYHQAAEFDSSSPGIYFALAENYYFLGEEKTSIKIINKALKLDPENLDALILLAACYEKQKNYFKAMFVYEDIVRLEPNNLEHLYYLTSLQIILYNYDKALKTYKSMLANGLDDPDFCLRIGYLFLQNRAYAQAEDVYYGIYKKHPELEEIYLALAATSKAKGDTTNAISWYKKALNYNYNFRDVRAELRRIYEKNKSWDDAITFYSSLITKDSTNLSNKLLLGNFYFQKGDTTNAIKIFERAVEQHPSRENAYLALGSAYIIKGDTLSAAKVYEKALNRQDSFYFYDVRQSLKEVFINQQKWQKAINLYEPLQGNDTTYVSSRLEIANIFLLQGDTLKAINYCKPLIETHSKDWRVPLNLGRFYFLYSNHEEARKYFDKTLELRKDLSHLWILRGINFIEMDSLDLALENFKASLKNFPDDPGLNYYTGSILSRQRKFAQAIEYFEKSSKKEPNNIQAILSLAGAYDELKKFEKSEKLYQKLIALNPESPIINNNYAYHLSIRGLNLDQALEYSKKALKADPENAPYLDTMGWIYYNLGDYYQAKYYIEKSLAIQQTAPEVMEHLGDIYFKLGDKNNAELYWKKAFELDSGRTHLFEKLGQSKK